MELLKTITKMGTIEIRTVEQMKANSKMVVELINHRANYWVCADSFIKVCEDEITIRQQAEDKYLSGVEYAAGV